MTPDRLQRNLEFGRCRFLEQIRRRAQPERFGHQFFGRMHAENDDGHLWILLAQLAHQLEPVVAAHREIGNHNIGHALGHPGQRLVRIGGFGNDDETDQLVDQTADTRTHQHMIIDQQNGGLAAGNRIIHTCSLGFVERQRGSDAGALPGRGLDRQTTTQ